MELIGYMLNTHDEYGPEDIRIVKSDADIQEAVKEYCQEFLNPTFHSEFAVLDIKDIVEALPFNQARSLISGWGGPQITKLGS